MHLSGVPNFGIVSTEPLILRGGQPTYEGWRQLKDAGITDVIKLNSEHEGTDLPALDFGMLVTYGPMGFLEQVVTEPDLDRLKSIVRCVSDRCFVHCLHGLDRTSLVVGMYRVMIQNWSVHVAYQEMLVYGFHPMLLGLAKAWHDFAQRYH